MESLLAHITAGLTDQRELVTTKSLAFILRRFSLAREGLRRLLGGRGRHVPVLDRIETEFVPGQESRPDIAIFDDRGKLKLLIEGKFWASLTSAQPRDYIRRLEECGGGTLVFVAPESRMQSISSEIIRRCQEAALLRVEDVPEAPYVVQVSGDVAMVIFSWQAVVDMLVDVAAASGDRALASDVDQLRGLCAAFESEGFRPVTQEDLSNIEIPRLFCSFSDLARNIAEAAKAEAAIEIGRRPYSHNWHSAGLYATFPHAGFWLGVDAELWRRYESSPLWVVFNHDDKWGRAQELRAVLRDWMDQVPPRMFHTERGLLIPIELRTGAERGSVVKHAISQLLEIRERLGSSGMKPRKVTAPEPSSVDDDEANL